MSATDIVRACPKCGMIVLVSCWHDGTTYHSVEMTKAKALVLLNRTKSGIQAELAHLEEHIKRAEE